MDEWTEEDLTLLENTIAGALANHFETDVSPALAELGWPDLAADPATPQALTAIRAVALAHGRYLKKSSALHLWILNGLAAREVIGNDSLHDLAVAIPLTTGRSGALEFVLLPAAPGGDVVTYLRNDGEPLLVRVESGQVQPLSLPALDPTLDVRAFQNGIDSSDVIATGDQAQESWDLVEAMITIATAQEIAGAAYGAIDLAVEHVSSRRQFGQPLGAFQAVQHQLAEAFAWVTALDEVCGSLISRGLFDSPRSLVGPVARLARQATAVSNAATQQVHGAIGYTEEYPLHRYVKRSLSLVGLLSGAGFLDRVLLDSGEDLWELLDLVEA